jgi:hypothetical protein
MDLHFNSERRAVSPARIATRSVAGRSAVAHLVDAVALLLYPSGFVYVTACSPFHSR